MSQFKVGDRVYIVDKKTAGIFIVLDLVGANLVRIKDVAGKELDKYSWQLEKVEVITPSLYITNTTGTDMIVTPPKQQEFNIGDRIVSKYNPKIIGIVEEQYSSGYFKMERDDGTSDYYAPENFRVVTTEELLGPDVPNKPKQQGLRFNNGKYNLNLIPRVALEAEARVFEAGHAKYGYNWETGQDWATPLACMRRHADAIAEGEWLDKESGLPHAAHVKANATMLLYFFYHNVGTNNIIARSEQVIPLPDITEKIKELNEKYKDKKLNLTPPYMPTPEIKDEIKGGNI